MKNEELLNIQTACGYLTDVERSLRVLYHKEMQEGVGNYQNADDELKDDGKCLYKNRKVLWFHLGPTCIR